MRYGWNYEIRTWKMVRFYIDQGPLFTHYLLALKI